MPRVPELPCEHTCPPWCTVDHDLQLHDTDRWHVSDPVAVPVAELRVCFSRDGGGHLELTAQQLDVHLEQRIGEHECFVAFGPADDPLRNYRLGLESVDRLAAALITAATRAREAPGEHE